MDRRFMFLKKKNVPRGFVCPCPLAIYMHMTLIFKHLLLENCRSQVSVYRTIGPLVMLKHMNRPMGKPTICIGENKDADRLRGNREANQRLCFRYSDSTIPLLLKSEISSF